MTQTSHRASERITISAAHADEIDALARSTHRTRSEIVDQALAQYLDANTWQIERIKAGLDAIRNGDTRPADDVFRQIATKHGWAS